MFSRLFSVKVILIFSTFLSFLPLNRGIREGLGRKNGSRADFRFLVLSLKQIRECVIVLSFV